EEVTANDASKRREDGTVDQQSNKNREEFHEQILEMREGEKVLAESGQAVWDERHELHQDVVGDEHGKCEGHKGSELADREQPARHRLEEKVMQGLDVESLPYDGHAVSDGTKYQRKMQDCRPIDALP